MNAAQLAEALRNGATIRTRWRNRKIKNELIMPNGDLIYVQSSTLNAVIGAGVLRTMYWAKGHVDYFLKEKS